MTREEKIIEAANKLSQEAQIMWGFLEQTCKMAGLSQPQFLFDDLEKAILNYEKTLLEQS